MEIFAQSPLNARNKRIEGLFRTLFMLMTLLLVLPVLIILGMLVIKGSPVISIDFLFTHPTDGMTAGGIFPALLGTVWLVTVALLVSVPLGIAAAVYLSEYAMENWFNRTINLAIINLAGVPAASIPIGVYDDGLPVGLQVVGARHRDADVIGIAHKIEKVADYVRPCTIG